jgi:CDGSH-type Zn-finger protein/uncharacterized Fe-S cluster protein YjdI
MKRKIHDYDAAGITIFFERKRCIHALDCVRALPDVFSLTRRRWIDATQASADEIAEVIERCPTGALHYRRKDGHADEQIPAHNEARLSAEGPLYLHGNLEIHSSAGVLEETRIALCRCGASRNQPFCDNSHEATGFQDGATARAAASATGSELASSSDVLRVTIENQGACVLEGTYSLIGSDGVTIENKGQRLSLCRCGRSLDMPLCDGTHLKTGLTAV